MNKPPLGAFGFTVDFCDGEDQATSYFQEVTGLSVKIETEDFHEGGVNSTTHKIIKHASCGNVTFKRGLTDNRFLDWVNQVLSGNIVRKDIIVSVLSDDGSVGLSYKLLHTVPVKWEGPNLNVMQDAIATESLEIAVEGLCINTLK